MELTDQVLSAYLDGELGAGARTEVEQVLGSDAGARARLERLRKADELMRRAIPQPETTYGDPLVQLIESGSRPKRQHVRIALIAFAAGVSGLVVGAFVASLIRGSGSGVPVASSLAPVAGDRVLATALDSLES